MEERKIKTVTLTLTQACNLSCTYCYEHHKSNRRMSVETAKSIVDYELKNFADFEGIEFDLFGGEPFLAFDLVREITDYICSKKGDIPCTVFATTNGTLVHGEVQDWLREHVGCFICGLSLDGTRDMHNVNRSNSYDDIDLDFFLEMYPEQDVKMTVSRETLPHLAEGVIELHQKGFAVSCNLAYEIDWSDPENLSVLTRELEALISFYLAHPEVEPCSMLNMGIYNVGLEQDEAFRYCGAGYSMRSYDVDGRVYPCQFFMPLSVGEDKAQKANEIVFPSEEIPKELLDDKCRSCIVRAACPNCFGANYAATGSIYQRDDNMCRLTKIIMKARSYFRAKQWEFGQLHETEDDLQTLLRAIIHMDLYTLGERKCALYAVIPDNDTTFTFLVSLLYSQIFQTLYYCADQIHHGALPCHVHFILDEAPSVNLPGLPRELATMRSRNISCSTIIQNMAQIKELYKDSWETIPGNSDTLLYLGGNEASTHKYISEALGKSTIDTKTHGQTKGRSGSYSTNFQMSGRELLTPDEVRMLDNRYCILFIRGTRPVMDEKYELMEHPAIRYTMDGGGPPYIHHGTAEPPIPGEPLFQIDFDNEKENAAA